MVNFSNMYVFAWMIKSYHSFEETSVLLQYIQGFRKISLGRWQVLPVFRAGPQYSLPARTAVLTVSGNRATLNVSPSPGYIQALKHCKILNQHDEISAPTAYEHSGSVKYRIGLMKSQPGQRTSSWAVYNADVPYWCWILANLWGLR